MQNTVNTIQKIIDSATAKAPADVDPSQWKQDRLEKLEKVLEEWKKAETRHAGKSSDGQASTKNASNVGADAEPFLSFAINSLEEEHDSLDVRQLGLAKSSGAQEGSENLCRQMQVALDLIEYLDSYAKDQVLDTNPEYPSFDADAVPDGYEYSSVPRQRSPSDFSDISSERSSDD